MQECTRDADCRDEYRCIELSSDNGWSATVVEQRSSVRVCALSVPESSQGETGFCEALPGDSSPALPPSRPLVPPGVDAGADAGQP